MEKTKVEFKHYSKESWSEKERVNVNLMCEFYNLLIVENDFDGFINRFGDSEYLQHNRIVETGIKPLLEFTKQLVKIRPEFHSELKHVYADDNFVVFRSHATLKKKHRGNDRKGLIIVDTWRIEEGRIAEHWDSLQPLSFAMRFFLLLGGGRRKNNNGIF